MSSSKQIKIGSVLSYLQMGIGIAIGLLYTPIMIRLLGKSEYGLYNLVSSTIATLSILNLGFNSGYVRYYAQYKNKNENEKIYRLNGMFLILFSIIGLIAFVCGMVISNNLYIVFKTGLTTEEYYTAKVLAILLTINLSISFPLGVFSNIIASNECFIFLKLVGIIKTVVSPLITLPLLLMGYRSIAMVTISLVIGLTVDAIYVYYVLVVLKNRFFFNQFEKGLLKSLFVYTSFIAMNTIIDQINWNIDKVLLGRYKGTSEVSVYSVGYVLYSYFMMFSTSISGMFTPRVHLIVNETQQDSNEQKRRLSELFIKVGRIQLLILGLISTGVLFFGKDFIVKYWVGEGYEKSYIVSLFLIFPAMIALIQNIGIEIQRAQNRHQFRSIVYLIMAFINLGISIILCQIYGAVGSVIGTAFSLIFANGLIMNIYYQRKCNIDIIGFWRSICRELIGFVIPICFGILINIVFTEKTIWQYMGCIALYVSVYSLSVYKISMNEYEKELCRDVFRRLKKQSES